MSAELIARFYDTRWQCPKCGRFISESAVGSEDYRDPDSYYGIGVRDWVDCPRCGRLDERAKIVPVRIVVSAS